MDRTDERSLFFRSPTRPRADFLRVRKPLTREDRLAHGRARSAVYRQQLDRRREPETATIAAAILAATLKATSIKTPMNIIIGSALDLLEEQGFDVSRVKDRLKRVRRRLTSTADVSIICTAAS